MIVLEVNKIFQNLIGMEPFGPSKYHRYFNPNSAFVSMFLLTLWTSLNFICNINEDIVEALSSMRTASGFFMMASLNWSFLINRAHFYSLFVDLQAVVNDST